MTIFLFSLLTFLFSILAGVVGALTGLGGAIIIIPALVLFLHVNIHYAMGAGIFAVMATSMGTVMRFLRQGYINLRVGMFLEVAAVIGALIGAYMTGLLSTAAVQIIFGCIFIIITYLSWRGRHKTSSVVINDPLAESLKLNSVYLADQGVKKISYAVSHVVGGFFMMFIAGLFSGLLGIGSGSLKVIALDQIMKLPYKVSTGTSNFMIGITAAVGASVFLRQGYINPDIIFPVVMGVLMGAFLGAKIMPHLPVKPLQLFFTLLIFLLAVEMIYKGVIGFHYEN